MITGKLKPGFAKLGKEEIRIYSINYEELSARIYYDVKNTFKLIILRNERQILLNREISRAQAFRIMNTRS
jgi:hypothetical protein